MKGAKRYKTQQNAISLVVCIMVFGLVVLLGSKLRGDKIVTPWYETFALTCTGGIIFWILGEYKAKRRFERERRRKTVQTIHPAIVNPPRGFKTCPYCGAEYANDATVCSTDHSDLVLK